VPDGQTDGQNYDSQDRASIAASRGKNLSVSQFLVNVGLLSLIMDSNPFFSELIVFLLTKKSVPFIRHRAYLSVIQLILRSVQ